MKEIRYRKILAGKAGGNASANALSYKIGIPTKWVTALGLSADTREVRMTLDGDKIILEAAKK